MFHARQCVHIILVYVHQARTPVRASVCVYVCVWGGYDPVSDASVMHFRYDCLLIYKL